MGITFLAGSQETGNQIPSRLQEHFRPPAPRPPLPQWRLEQKPRPRQESRRPAQPRPFRAELSDCRVEVGGWTMATESCLSLASSRDRPTNLTVGCWPSRSWSRNPGEEEQQGRRVIEGKTLIIRQRREKTRRRPRRQEAHEGWKNAALAKMRLLRRGSRSFAESVTSSLPRKSRPSADIASGKTSSGGTKTNAKNVLTR